MLPQNPQTGSDEEEYLLLIPYPSVPSTKSFPQPAKVLYLKPSVVGLLSKLKSDRPKNIAWAIKRQNTVY